MPTWETMCTRAKTQAEYEQAVQEQPEVTRLKQDGG